MLFGLPTLKYPYGFQFLFIIKIIFIIDKQNFGTWESLHSYSFGHCCLVIELASEFLNSLSEFICRRWVFLIRSRGITLPWTSFAYTPCWLVQYVVIGHIALPKLISPSMILLQSLVFLGSLFHWCYLVRSTHNISCSATWSLTHPHTSRLLWKMAMWLSELDFLCNESSLLSEKIKSQMDGKHTGRGLTFCGSWLGYVIEN